MRLKEFLEQYGDFVGDDITLIQKFIQHNGLELEAITMLANIAHAKTSLDKLNLDKIRGNVSLLSYNDYRDFYPKDIADKFRRASYDLAIGEDVTKMGYWDWFVENVPKIKLVKGGLLWRDLYELLRKNGLYFLGEYNNEGL